MVGDVNPAVKTGREGWRLWSQLGVNECVKAERRTEGDQQRQGPVQALHRFVGDNRAERMTNDNLGLRPDPIKHSLLCRAADLLVTEITGHLRQRFGNEAPGKGKTKGSKPA